MQIKKNISLLFIKFRCENNLLFEKKNNNYYFFNNFLHLSFFNNFFFSAYTNIKQRSNFFLIYQNLIFSNKGLSYLFGLPVNGQRTWSNGRNSKKINCFLINYKVKQFKSMLSGAVNLNNLKLIIFLNYFNWIWKIFWKKDWSYLLKRNKKLMFKNYKKKKMN